MFSSVRQGVFFHSSRGIDGFVKESFFAQLPQVFFSDKSSTTRLFVFFFFLMAERKSKCLPIEQNMFLPLRVAQNEDTTFLPINLSKTT